MEAACQWVMSHTQLHCAEWHAAFSLLPLQHPEKSALSTLRWPTDAKLAWFLVELRMSHKQIHLPCAAACRCAGQAACSSA